MMMSDDQMAPSPNGVFRPMRPGQVSRLTILDLRSDEEKLVLETDRLIEAPNWHPDGQQLIVNGWGKLFSIGVDTGGVDCIAVVGIENINNDHVLSADGENILFSAGGGVFSVSLAGGRPTRLTNAGATSYYLHGLSPDGAWLACTSVRTDGRGPLWGIALVPMGGGETRTYLEGDKPVDGPEWSPDGEWLWFNGEIRANIEGHSSIFRIHLASGAIEQMTFGDRVDWFPHIDPSGRRLVYLSYPPGTVGHPANCDVEIRTMDVSGANARTVARPVGGQGSINVNSFAPDGRRFAYVSYPGAGELGA